MKKMLCLLIALSLLVSFGVTASAEDTAMESILKTVKERIPSTEEYDRLDSRTSVDYRGNIIYSFNWMTEGEDYRELSVAVTGSGIILSYYMYTGDKSYDDTPSINRKTYDEVMPVCESFLEKINPGIYKSLVLSRSGIYENLGAYGYEFEIQRTEGGIPVYGDDGYIRLSVDGTAVESFYINYTEGLGFENAEKLISPEEAQKAFGEKQGLKLYYITQIKDGKKTVIPVYAPDGEYNSYISAVTGEVVSPVEPDNGTENGKYMLMNTQESAADSASGGGVGFTEAEKAELENVANLISREKAEEIARTNTVLNIDEGYGLYDAQLNKDYYDTERYFWSLQFEGKGVYASVRLDASDGRIVYFSKNRSYAAEAAIETDKAKNTAFDAIESLAPQFFPQDGESPYVPEESTDGYSYYWIRHENGIPFPQGRAYVHVDKLSGEVVGYNLVHENLEFPTLENVIAKNMALKSLFSQVDFSVNYIKTCSKEGINAYDSAMAVYMLDPGVSAVMNAEDGELIYSRKQAEIAPYTDISGHFSETAAETLRKYGVGFTDGRFMPDELITQGELMALLNCVFGSSRTVVIATDSDFTAAYNTANRKGILTREEYSPQSNVTREEAAIMLIRAMGLEQAAVLTGIYNCPFPDVTENKGYVSILGAMGVFKGDGMGNFNPDALLTRGEAAVVLYNYLKI